MLRASVAIRADQLPPPCTLKLSLAQPLSNFRLHRKHIGRVLRKSRVQLVRLLLVRHNHPQPSLVQRPEITFHHSLQPHDRKLHHVDQRVKDRSQRRLSIEERDIDERNRRHMRRVRHHTRATGANALIKRRVRNGLARLRHVSYSQALESFRGEKLPQLGFYCLRQWTTGRMVFLTLLPHPGSSFSNQSRDLRLSELRRLHEQDPSITYS